MLGLLWFLSKISIKLKLILDLVTFYVWKLRLIPKVKATEDCKLINIKIKIKKFKKILNWNRISNNLFKKILFYNYFPLLK